MTGVARLAFALLAAALLAWVERAAHAEPPSAKAIPVYVLTIWTDDSDDQAEALTQALRARIRQAQGWSLLETGQSFETLAIALKCPSRPDSGCLQHIGDQLHADHYVWGTMTRRRGVGEVTVDLHLWSRGRGETVASEAFSDNLREANEDAVKQVAARLFAKLTGGVVGGTVVVRAGRGTGVVLIDGVERTTLEGGTARVDVEGGTHSIAVQTPGSDPVSQTVNVTVGAEQEVTLSAPGGSSAQPPDRDRISSFPLRKGLSYGAAVAGAALLVASGIEAVAWINDKNANHDDRLHVSSGNADVCANQENTYAVDACRKSHDAVTVSTLAWAFGAGGAALLGAGIVLLVTDHGSSEGVRAQAPRRVQITPHVGARGGRLDLRLDF
jgi:hypothetical protein